jgi:hypothetical protein
LYGSDSKKMEVAEIFFLGGVVAVREVTAGGRSRPMILSWGLSSAVYTAMLAGDPL